MNIEQYWADFFGVDAQRFNEPSTSIVPHAALSDYWGIWVFVKGSAVIISSPAVFLPVCKRLVGDCAFNTLSELESVQRLFQGYAERIIGPAYHGTLDFKNFQPSEKHSGNEISFEESQALNDGADPTGWDDSGAGEERARYFGVYSDGELVAISNYSIIQQVVAFPGVYTHPRFRGHGYSTTALSLAFRALLNDGLLMDYQTLSSNIPSIKTAERLGVKEFAKHTAIRLKE